MGRSPPRRLKTRPQSAARITSARRKIPCPVNGQVKTSPRGWRWAGLLLAGALAIAQAEAVQLGKLLAPESLLEHAGLDPIVAPHREGPASAPVVRAKAHHLQVRAIAEARAAEQRGDHATAQAVWSSVYVHTTAPKLRARARDAIVERASKTWPKGFRSRFLTSLSPAVLTAAREHRVLPSVTLAQAILESGWGRSSLTRDYHNLFGVKAGRSSQRIRLASREHVGGRFRPSRQTFRRYDSKAQSILDHAELLSSDRRYAHARPHWTDRQRFLEAIAPRYASSPNYVSAVSRLIELYDLDQWDALIVAAVEADTRVRAPIVTADAPVAPEDDTPDTGQPPPLDG